MPWKVVYFISSSGKNPVSQFIDSCTKNQQVKVLKIPRCQDHTTYEVVDYGAMALFPPDYKYVAPQTPITPPQTPLTPSE